MEDFDDNEDGIDFDFTSNDVEISNNNNDNANNNDSELDSETKVEESLEERANRLRFSMELEFIQCLASPQYINHLAQARYFQDPAFINYLAYLQYWKQPQYAQYIVYPHSLYFLDLLQQEPFRNEMANPQYMEYVHKLQFFHWQFYKQNRLNTNPSANNNLTTETEQQPLPVPR
eukprot:TRINITY_DN4705_c0_g1_i2.p1 TRINITY_DN4705_c0_g1~~TRINITY_DN4705_c0_g1_i2.p1  ORF type:complete len:175 (-),score=40.14 TRINITY_DN4705_c0_g1_i2:223-747(-)